MELASSSSPQIGIVYLSESAFFHKDELKAKMEKLKGFPKKFVIFHKTSLTSAYYCSFCGEYSRHQITIFPIKELNEAAIWIERLAKRRVGLFAKPSPPPAPQPLNEQQKNHQLVELVKSVPGLNGLRGLRALKLFKSLISLANAGEQDLKMVENLGPVAAKQIYEFFHQSTV
eukprot:TRINITY_DN1644_c0_g1_i14.p2 TRINITY_DN1644_c0_g1~~TRINITY_DN1644_c0_g1_i14.p2  ORF type:complete len:173 (+),score=36.78 TRINITY_DN1644_c0_g1_i14:311-829(+)